jgi:archaellum component FlaC
MNYFVYPKIALMPFPYSKISYIKQCEECFEYIVNQIENIGGIINWIASEQSITIRVFHESEAISPGFKDAKKDITACYESISRVKTIVEIFLTNDLIIRNNQETIIELAKCNDLRDTVNNQTERVELIINQYKKGVEDRVSLLSPSLNSSIEMYFNVVNCFYDIFDKYRRKFHIS